MRTIPTITHAINWYERPKPGIVSRICRTFPLLLKLAERLPQFLRRIILDPHISINERIVEVPWVFMNLGLRQGKILDVGCCYSEVSMELASLGFEVWGIDVKPCTLTHPNFKFVQDDICHGALSEGFFDCVLAISTVEHVGLGYYQKAVQPDEDRQAMREIYRVLKPGGRFLMTVPFGQRRVTSWFRVYDPQSLEQLLQPFDKHIRQECYLKRDGHWSVATQQQAAQAGLTERGQPAAVALVEAVK